MDKVDESIARNEEIENGGYHQGVPFYFHFQKRPAESNCGVMATSPALLIYPLLSPMLAFRPPEDLQRFKQLHRAAIQVSDLHEFRRRLDATE